MSVQVGMSLTDVVGFGSQIIGSGGGAPNVLVGGGLSFEFGKNNLGLSGAMSQQITPAPSLDMRMGL
jgi:hypothetical protein